MTEQLPEPEIENVAIQKVAISLQDYEEYGVAAGDAIAFGLYMKSYDIDPTAWNDFLSIVPILSLIDHEWQVWEDGNNLPEIKTIDI